MTAESPVADGDPSPPPGDPLGDLFADIVGQPEAVVRLRTALRSPVPAYLFVGPAGSGKRRAAREFAGALFARGDGAPGDALGEAATEEARRHLRLARAETHPDLVVVERTGATITAEQAREVVRVASTSPVEAEVKVLLLVDFHLVGGQAAIVLKAVEEPPPSTVFVILAEDVPPELVTIASRCVRIDFHAVPVSMIEADLIAAGVDDTTARVAAEASGGDLTRARLLVEDPGLVRRRQAWAGIADRLDGTGARVADLVDTLIGLADEAAKVLEVRHGAELAELEERVSHFGERGSGRRALADRQKRELRRVRVDEFRGGLSALGAHLRDELSAGRLPPGAVVEALELLAGAARDLSANPNERLLLSALLLRLGEVLGDG